MALIDYMKILTRPLDKTTSSNGDIEWGKVAIAGLHLVQYLRRS